jgi:hypothetical protein
MNRTALVLAALTLAAGAATAQEMPVPQVFNHGFKKGQWRVEMLQMSMGKTERAGGGMPAMSICMDDVQEMGRNGPGGRNTARGCKARLVKNTATEAIMESACADGTTRTTVTREGDNSYRIHSTGTRDGENYAMQARYTFEGETCTQSGFGIGGMGRGAGPAAKGTMRNDSPECQRARAQMGSMNPGAMCVNAGANRAACEQNIQRMRSQLEAACQ